MKMSQNQILLGLILIVVLVFATSLSIGGAGFSTLSLIQGTTYSSTDPLFNGPAYTLVVAVDGSGSSAKGTFTPDQIKAFTGGTAPSNNVDIEINLNNQTCTYTLLPTPIPVYAYNEFSVCGRYSGNALLTDGKTYMVCTNQVSGTTDRPYAQPGTDLTTEKIKIGEIFLLDTVAHYDSDVGIILATGDHSYVSHLTPTHTSDRIGDSIQTNFVGSLMGVQSCPNPATNIVLYRPIGTSTLIPKSNAMVNTISSYETYIPSYPTTATVINAFLSSPSPLSAYCEDQTVSGTTTLYKCVPASPVAIPVIKMVIKAENLGINVPSGNPQIISVSAPQAEPADTTRIDVRVKNIGTETDSFDAALTGKRQLNIQATRTSIAAGQEATIPVRFQGAGIIGNYTITVASVNTPTNKDSESFKLMINPFCDRVAEPGKIKINTEFGCMYICQNQYTGDIREQTCQPFGTFEPSGKPYNASGIDNGKIVEYWYQGEKHCVGIGQYKQLNYYMADVLAGSISKFVPATKENAQWISAPTCNYVGDYGYRWDGTKAVEVVEYEYVVGTSPAVGTEVAGVVIPPANITPIPPPEPVIPPVTPPVIPPISPVSDNNMFIYIGVAILIIVAGLYLTGNLKRIFKR